MSLPARVLGERSPLRKFLGSKEHLDSLKIYLNAAKIITVQNFKTAQWKNLCLCFTEKAHACAFGIAFTLNSYPNRLKSMIFFSKIGD